MKRRLKHEIQSKKKYKPFDKDSDEAREFEESLLKLAQLAKNRIKLADFTSQDKLSLLDLFVNNEKTLLKIYEALFPHKNTNLSDNNQNNTYRSTSIQGMGQRSVYHSKLYFIIFKFIVLLTIYLSKLEIYRFCTFGLQINIKVNLHNITIYKYRDLSILEDSFILSNTKDQHLAGLDGYNTDPLYIPGDLNSRNHSVMNTQLNYSLESKEINKDFGSILPSIRNQSFENENPYKITRTKPSLLNQNIAF